MEKNCSHQFHPAVSLPCLGGVFYFIQLSYNSHTTILPQPSFHNYTFPLIHPLIHKVLLVFHAQSLYLYSHRINGQTVHRWTLAACTSPPSGSYTWPVLTSCSATCKAKPSGKADGNKKASQSITLRGFSFSRYRRALSYKPFGLSVSKRFFLTNFYPSTRPFSTCASSPARRSS